MTIMLFGGSTMPDIALLRLEKQGAKSSARLTLVGRVEVIFLQTRTFARSDPIPAPFPFG
jgi:hypothetical protein